MKNKCPYLTTDRLEGPFVSAIPSVTIDGYDDRKGLEINVCTHRNADPDFEGHQIPVDVSRVNELCLGNHEKCQFIIDGDLDI